MSAPLNPAPAPAPTPTPNDAAAAVLAAAQAAGAPAPGAVAPAAPPDPAAAAPASPAPGPTGSEDSTLTHEQALEALKAARQDAAKYRTRAKELEPLAQAAREAEQAQMTELQREQARNAELTEQLEASQLQALVATHSIPEEYQSLVAGATPEAREAAAHLVGQLVAKANTVADPSATPGALVAPPSNRPVEGLRPGASPAIPAQPDHSYPAGWLPASPGQS